MRIKILAAAIASIVPLTVLAQTSPSISLNDASSDTVPEVVVTARKVSERLQEVPVAITAISGNDLKNESIKDLNSMQGLVPGLLLQPGADNPQSLLLLLRGREQNDVALPIDSSVGLYVDGHYVPRTLGMLGSLLDINRVEVLRGPQGTLYGKNTTGGALSVFTNDPTDSEFASLDATVGNYGAFNLVGIANVPINSEMAARFVAQRGIGDGYGHDASGHELLTEDSQTYRAKLRANFGERWSALLSGDFQRYKTGGPILNISGLTPAGGGLPRGAALTLETELETNRTETQALAYLDSLIAAGRNHIYDNAATFGLPSNSSRQDVDLTIRGNLGHDITFVSITGYQHTDNNFFFALPVPGQSVFISAGSQDSYYSQEFQLLGRTGPFKWVAGVYVDYESGHDYNDSTLFPQLFAILGAPPRAISANELINSTVAPFGQATWEFIDRWRLTGGIRYSSDTRTLHASDVTIDQAGTILCVVPAPGVESTAVAGAAAQCPRKFKNTFGQPSWLLSIDHSVSDDILIYTRVASGYRSGGQNEGGAVEIESFAPFKQETNVEYEVGGKTEFFEHKVRLNVAAYRDDYSNLQVTTNLTAADGNFVTRVGNAATATIVGLEAEADFIIARGLKVHASTAYTGAHYNRFIDMQLGDRSHEPFTVPRWTANFSPQYEWPTRFGAILGILDYDFKSAINYSPSVLERSEVTQKSVGLLNGRLNFHIDSWSTDIALFGKNIASKKYYSNAAPLPPAGVNLVYSAAPATYGIEIIKNFGK